MANESDETGGPSAMTTEEGVAWLRREMARGPKPVTMSAGVEAMARELMSVGLVDGVMPAEPGPCDYCKGEDSARCPVCRGTGERLEGVCIGFGACGCGGRGWAGATCAGCGGMLVSEASIAEAEALAAAWERERSE